MTTATVVFYHSDCEKDKAGKFHSQKVVHVPEHHLKIVKGTNLATMPLKRLLKLVDVPKHTHYLLEVENEFDFN